MNLDKFQWTRQPEEYRAEGGRVEMVTRPRTDLWQRTYYHFQNDNAPVFQICGEDGFFPELSSV